MRTEPNPRSKPRLPPAGIIQAVNKIRGGVNRLQQKMVPPHVALLELVTGQWVSQAVGVAARLGVADHIPAEGISVEILAKKVQAKPEPLYRLLRALSTVGLFHEKEGRIFQLLPVGACLRSDHPQSMRAMSQWQSEINWASWGELEYSVRHGKNAAEKVHGEPLFDHFSKHPAKARVFDQAMTNISAMEAETILAAYDFSPFPVIADVGGGHGAMLSRILELNPYSAGVLFDLPHVVEGAKKQIASKELKKRLTFQGGSFFEEVPAGADAYVLKHIIHDWSDEESRKILKLIRKTMAPKGKVLLLEAVVSGRNEPHFSKFLDLEMLVVTTGKERTRDEFAELLKSAGLKLDRVVPTVSMACVIEASAI